MDFDSALRSRHFFRFTGPPEHWLTAIKYMTWGLERHLEERWQKIQTGDIFFIHSTGSQNSAFPKGGHRRPGARPLRSQGCPPKYRRAD